MNKEDKSFAISIVSWMLLTAAYLLASIELLREIYYGIFGDPKYDAPIFVLIWFCISGAYLLYWMYKIAESVAEKSANRKQEEKK